MKVFDDNSKYIYGKNPVREKLKLIKNGVLFIKKGIQHSTIIDIIKKAKSKNIEICFVDNESFKNLSMLSLIGSIPLAQLISKLFIESARSLID